MDRNDNSPKTPIDRRQFIAGVAALGASTTLPAWAQKPSTKTGVVRVWGEPGPYGGVAVDAMNEWAKKFAMSPDNANKLISALKQAKTGKAQALNNLGLKKEDLRAIAKYEVPSQETVKVLAKNLNQLPKNTESMLSQLVLAAKKLK